MESMQTKQKPCLTLRAVNQQLRAMNSNTYELGVRNEKTGATRRFPSLHPSEITKRVQWLKSENMKGNHVYIRPDDGSALILIDDVSEKQIALMSSSGLNPALCVLTSDGNYQAWVRLSFDKISSQIATEAAKILCLKFGGDPGSAEGKHFGRLAGFTNVKPKYVDERGHYPFVKVSGSRSGGIARAGAEILSNAYAAIKAPITLVEQRNNLPISNVPSEYHEAAMGEYGRQMEALQNRYGQTIDNSKADWMIARSMFTSGYSLNSIAFAMKELSPKASKKGKNGSDYVELTISKISQTVEFVSKNTKGQKP